MLFSSWILLIDWPFQDCTYRKEYWPSPNANIHLFFFLVFMDIGCLNLGFLPLENTSKAPPCFWLFSFLFFSLIFIALFWCFWQGIPKWNLGSLYLLLLSSSINSLISLELITPTSYLVFECAFSSQLLFSPFFISKKKKWVQEEVAHAIGRKGFLMIPSLRRNRDMSMLGMDITFY